MSITLKHFSLLILGLISCLGSEDSSPPAKVSNELSIAQLDPIWYSGKAELSTYDLKQNRYDGIHDGEAVMIFVTEPFNTKKQVKNESGTNKNSASTLKNNQIRRFTTGIYDYSIFTSIFTDANDANTYKVTNSSQDWCGQSYSQLNKTKRGYQYELRSYFESEGDQNIEVLDAILEDELYNYIRLDETLLPKGSFKILIASHVARLLHQPFKAIEATGSIQDYENKDMKGQKLKSYKIQMPSLQRSLEIIYDSATSTNEIVGWKDSSPSVFDQKIRTTTATRKEVIWSAYWSQNGVHDTEDREKLLLSNY